MKRQFSVVIAGAGIVGLCHAALLKQGAAAAQLKLTIVDAATPPAFSEDKDIALRVSAISTGSVRVLQNAGGWSSAVGARACPYTDMRVWDSTGAVEGPETLHFSAADCALQQLGYITENSHIQDALLKTLDRQRQDVEFATSIRAVDREDAGFSVSLSDGRVLRADLLIAADGRNSFVRQQVGITAKSWSYDQVAFVTHLLPEIPHASTAWQRFLRSGPLALLPLLDGRVSLVWSTTPDEAHDAKLMSDDDLSDLLSEKSDYVLGRLTPDGPRGTFPLRAQFATQYVQRGLALIGDAAHSVHPLAGQGANLGIADAACLAKIIDSAVLQNEVISDFRVLRRYERARKGPNQSMLRFIDGINRLFGANSNAVATLRATGMRAFNRVGPARDYTLRVALGINDDEVV